MQFQAVYTKSFNVEFVPNEEANSVGGYWVFEGLPETLGDGQFTQYIDGKINAIKMLRDACGKADVEPDSSGWVPSRMGLKEAKDTIEKLRSDALFTEQQKAENRTKVLAILSKFKDLLSDSFPGRCSHYSVDGLPCSFCFLEDAIDTIERKVLGA